jgi:hypothetical protein
MASVLKVDKLDPQSGTALEIGSSGDTITIPSGATFTQSGTMNASAITAGTVATARLGSGTADATTFLRGDQTYAAAGKMGQMISTQLAVEQSTTSTTFVAITGVTNTITPAATSSKIWVQGNLFWGRSTNNTMWMQMYRDAVLINEQTFATASDTESYFGSGVDSGYYFLRSAPFSFLDSPSTTSATVYTIQWRGDGNTLYLNRIGGATNQAGTSQLNTIEVLA